LGLIQQYKSWRDYNKRAVQTLEEILLQAGIGTDSITKDQALNIPSVAGCVEVICNTIAMLNINLFSETDGKVSTVNGDKRVKLLNDDTKDTLSGIQFKKSLLEDYLLYGAGYAYINKQLNSVQSIHYVDNRNISVNINADPIFKDYDILCNGSSYRPFEFIKITRKTKDGVTGRGIVAENNDAL
jgi:phage portal protein BeeE